MWLPPNKWDKDKLARAQALCRREKTVRHFLNKKQREFYDLLRVEGIDHAGLYCSRKVGKTFFILLDAYEFCWNNPGATVRIVLPELKQARDTVIPITNEFKAFLPAEMLPQLKVSELKLVFKNGAIIALGGAKKENAESNRGPIAHRVYRDECAAWEDEPHYSYITNAILLPQMTTTGGMLIDTTTPAKAPTHPWIVSDLVKLQGKGHIVSFDIDENPLLTPEQIERIVERYGGRDNPDFQREYKLKLVSEQSMRVVPEYPAENDQASSFVRTVKPQKGDRSPDGLPMDYYGYSAADLGVVDYTCILGGFYSPLENKLIVTSESFERGGGLQNFKDAFMPIFQELLGESVDYWEPPSVVDCFEQTRMALLKDFNMKFQRPSKRKLEDSVAYLRAHLYAGHIEILDSCTMLRAQLRLGTWKATGTENKDFDRSETLGHLDGIATLMYLVRRIPWGRVPTQGSEGMSLTGGKPWTPGK